MLPDDEEERDPRHPDHHHSPLPTEDGHGGTVPLSNLKVGNDLIHGIRRQVQVVSCLSLLDGSYHRIPIDC